MARRRTGPMHPSRNGEFWESARYDTANFRSYYNRLTELAISTFKWSGLPDTIDERFLELILFGEGRALFFEEPDIGPLALQVAPDGMPNVYNVPNRRTAYAVNGFHRVLGAEDSVIVWNNRLRTPSRIDVEIFAKRLADLDATIDINTRAQKTPILILCDENQRLTLKNLYMQYDGNQPVIFGDRNSLNLDTVKVLTTGAPYVAGNLYQLKTQIWNEALTYLGISNLSINKRERLISDEVSRAQGGTIASRYSRLAARQAACEEINRMFGLDIWCDFRDNDDTADYSLEAGPAADEEVQQDE